MYHQPEHVGHWEGLEMWLSATTNSILPKAAEALQHQTQDQLDDNITSIMRQDPSQNYNHKELAKITSSLSHTLIATLKLSDKYAAQRQQELTSAQRRIEQLEREAQVRREGTDEVEQGADEEINRLKETLEATRHEMQQLKEDFADCADKLQYAEKLLEKAKTDFRDKNSRIKALEAHLAESRNEISRLTQQLDYVTEESESFQEELKHAYELRQEPSRTGRAPTAPLPSRTKSPVPGLTREHKTEGVVLKTVTSAVWRTLYHDRTRRICCSQPQIVAQLGPKRPWQARPKRWQIQPQRAKQPNGPSVSARYWFPSGNAT